MTRPVPPPPDRPRDAASDEPPHAAPDAALVRRVLAGDAEAFVD